MTPAKVLIVDDEPQLLAANQRILTKAGYEVITAPTGREGIARAKDHRPDLVLLDVMLPDINGVEVCRQIKATPELAEVFVILLSSIKTRSFDQADGLDAGADGYIARPISNRELVSRINTMMRIKRTETELRIQKEWLRVTLTSAGDGVIATDPKGFVTFLNPVAEEVTGWPAQKALGRPIDQVFPLYDETNKEVTPNPVRRVLSDGTPIYLETYATLGTLDGRQVPIADSAAPILKENGKLQGVILLFQDVTEKIEAQKALQARCRELDSISKLTNTIKDCLTAEEVHRNASEALMELVQPDAMMVFVKNGRNLHLKDLKQLKPKFEPDDIPIHKVGDCLCGLAISRHEPQYALDIHTDDRCTWKECIEAGFRSYAALPLESRGELIGVLGLASEQERDFTEQAPFLEALAGQIAPRLQMAMLYEELEERVEERTEELQQLVDLMAGREVRMAELKRVIRKLRGQLEAAGLKPVANDPLLESPDLPHWK